MKKNGVLAIAIALLIVMQYMLALPVSAAQSIYSLGVIAEKALDFQGATTSTKSFAAAQVGDKTYAYAGKEGTSGGIYIYDVTDAENIAFVDYTRTVGGASIGGTPHNDRMDVASYEDTSYLVFIGTNGMTNNANGAYAARINSDGTLGEYIKLGDTTYWDSYIESEGNYVFYNTKTEIFVFELTASGFVSRGKLTASENQIMKFAARAVDGKLYMITASYNTGTAKYSTELYTAEISNNMSFEKKSGMVLAKPNYLLYGIDFISDTHAVIGYDNQGTGGVYLVDISDTTAISADVVSEGRVWAVLGLEDGYFVASCLNSDGTGNVKLYCYDEHISSAKIGGYGIDCSLVNGKLYIIPNNTSKLSILSYKTGVYITSTEACIEPSYKLVATVDGILENDTLLVSVNDEETDVTAYTLNGILSYDIAMENGSYDISLKLLRNNEVVVSDSVSVSAELLNQIELSGIVKNNSSGTMSISLSAENLYSSTLASGTVFAVLYNEDEMVSYDYADISGLGAGESIIINNLTLAGYRDGMTIKLFAVSGMENARLVSDITVSEGVADSFKISVSENDIARTTDKINVIPYIDPMTNNFKISMANIKEEKADALVFVTEGTSADLDKIHFIYTGETDAMGYLGFSYLITNPPSEGDEYGVFASLGKYAAWESNSCVKGYYGITTVNSMLSAIEGSNPDTIYGVLTEEINNKLLMLDFSGTYSELDYDPYQKNVLSAIAGKTFSDPAAVINAFNSAVSEQLTRQTEDRLDKALLDLINAATEETIEGIISTEANYVRAGLKLDGLYSELSPQQKKGLAGDALVDKGFTTLGAAKQAFENALIMKVISEFEYTQMIENTIIEKHYAELGISEADKNYYVSSDKKADIIKNFLASPITGSQAIGGAFANAVNTVKNMVVAPGGNASSRPSSGGGGSVYVPKVNKPISETEIDLTQKPDDPDDEITFDDVNKNAWYYESIYNLAQKGYVEGITDNLFYPEKTITREEFTKMAVLAFGYYNQAAKTDFSDTAEYKWHYRYIASAEAAGIINGTGSGDFGVGETITRQDMAVILYRIIQNKGIVLPEINITDFSDAYAISGYAKDSVDAMYASGIITGFPDRTFRPAETATRAMAAKVIWEILNI